MQRPLDPRATAPEDQQEYEVQLEPPGFDQVFGHLDSEDALKERMRQKARNKKNPERISFPDDYTPHTNETYAGRFWPPMAEVVEAAYLCYGKLCFEQINMERYGWDLGFISPLVSAGKFFTTVPMLGCVAATPPCCECNSGYCLPGDPVPLLCYPPKPSLTGVLTDAGVWVALPAIFP